MPALRIATAEDAPAITDVLLEGFATYRAFAPADWRPPDRAPATAGVAARLRLPETLALVAEDDRGMVGHGAFVHGLRSRPPSGDSAQAHLWMLFVRERGWGTGLARKIHRELVREARLRGYARMRLFTPEGQARARRFYEREGWRPSGLRIDDSALGLALVEYRRAL